MNDVASTHSAAHVAEASARLHALPPIYGTTEVPRLVAALCQSGIRLLGADRSLAQELRHQLQGSTGLSPEMIEWGLSTTLSTLHPHVLDAIAHEVGGTPGLVPVPARLVAVVLAGNVFSAAVRAICLPLLSGAPVLVKGSSTDDVLPQFLLRTLHETDPEIGRRCELVRFGRDAESATDALLRDAEVVSIYGDDTTTAELSARARAGTRIVQHGHGLSASYVSTATLRDPIAALDAARRVALDVAAYDQRGCLSPQIILVERGGAIEARGFARILFEEALPELGRLLPPGAASIGDRAEALQWRAAAQVRGELFDGGTFAVSYEADCDPRPSPGGRLVGVYDCDSPDRASQTLRPFGSALKCIGVAGPRDQRLRLAQSLRLAAAARVCRAGEMQTPPFHAYADGQAPLAGLLSFIEAH